MKTSTHRNADVERYIHELAIALAGLPVEDREDVIAGVREHIEASLADITEPDAADVARILESLGDPLAIAADAGAPSAVPSPTDGATSTHARSTSETLAPPGQPSSDEPLRASWVPPAAMLALAAGTIMLVLTGPGSLTLTGLMWLAGFVLLVASPLWRAGEVAIGITVMASVMAVGFFLLGGFATDLFFHLRVNRLVDPFGYQPLVSLAGMAIFAAAGLALLLTWMWLWKRGASRVTATRVG